MSKRNIPQRGAFWAVDSSKWPSTGSRFYNSNQTNYIYMLDTELLQRCHKRCCQGSENGCHMPTQPRKKPLPLATSGGTDQLARARFTGWSIESAVMAMPRCLPFHPGQGCFDWRWWKFRAGLERREFFLECQGLFDDSDKQKVAYLTYANLCFLIKHMIFVQAIFRWIPISPSKMAAHLAGQEKSIARLLCFVKWLATSLPSLVLHLRYDFWKTQHQTWVVWWSQERSDCFCSLCCVGLCEETMNFMLYILTKL